MVPEDSDSWRQEGRYPIPVVSWGMLLTLPVWALLMALMAATQEDPSPSLRIAFIVGWCYGPCVVAGLLVARRRTVRSRRQWLVRSVGPAGVVVLVWVLIGLLQDWLDAGWR